MSAPSPNNAMSEQEVTIFATVISSAVALLSSAFFSWLQDRGQTKRDISAGIGKMIDIAIQYPEVENPLFCDSWPAYRGSPDQKIRYENYCCFVFNLIALVWEFCKRDHTKIESVLHVDEILLQHRSWWMNDRENLKAYDRDFVRYADDRIAELEKANGSAGNPD